MNISALNFSRTSDLPELLMKSPAISVCFSSAKCYILFTILLLYGAWSAKCVINYILGMKPTPGFSFAHVSGLIQRFRCTSTFLKERQLVETLRGTKTLIIFQLIIVKVLRTKGLGSVELNRIGLSTELSCFLHFLHSRPFQICSKLRAAPEFADCGMASAICLAADPPKTSNGFGRELVVVPMCDTHVPNTSDRSRTKPSSS